MHALLGTFAVVAFFYVGKALPGFRVFMMQAGGWMKSFHVDYCC